jgi:hypothetical protein
MIVLYGFAGYMERAAYLIVSVYWLVGGVDTLDFDNMSVSNSSALYRQVLKVGGFWVV